ncbi:mCG146167, partial [Mus musculus]
FYLLLPSAVDLCSCSDWFVSSEPNKTVTRSLLLRHLQPLNKGLPLKFGLRLKCLRLKWHLSSLLLRPTDLWIHCTGMRGTQRSLISTCTSLSFTNSFFGWPLL